MELSVIVPCLNEEANLPELINRVGEVFRMGNLQRSPFEDGFAPSQVAPPSGAAGAGLRPVATGADLHQVSAEELSAELVIVDDGSTDRTWAVLEEHRRRLPFVVGVRHGHNQGIAAAWRSGVRAARGHLVCIIDADLQYQPEDILRLRRELYWSNVDIVQGWRSPVGREKGPRYYYSRGLNSILNYAFGMDLRDNKSGFLLTSREVLADLLDFRGRYAYWQSFIMVAAHHKGYTYKQVETLFENRRAGTSFLAAHPVRPILRSFVDIGRALAEYRMRPARSSDLAPFLGEAQEPAPAEPLSLPRRLHLQAYLQTFGLTHDPAMTRDVASHVRDLERSQWLPPEAVRELQEAKLRRLVHHAYQHVPYYRDRLRAVGVAPTDIRGLDDLPKLPMLTKEDIRRHLYFDIMSDNHHKAEVVKISTSGSTGEPSVCYVDRAQLEFRWAATLRAQEWTGYRFGDRCLRLWHEPLSLARGQLLRERAEALLSRRRIIPAYEMSEDTLLSYVRAIEEWRPVLLDGYAESFHFLAGYLRDHGRLRGAGEGWPRGIMTSAQTLPERSRRLIEDSFGCPVFDAYGAREFSGIAYECAAHAGHHVVAEGYLVEVIKDGRPARPGEVGEVVITDLNNYCLPFLRYRIGDLAEAMDPAQRCACGRGLPRVGRIEGRMQSIIVGADGRYVPGTFFAHLFKDYDHAVRQFQLVQERRGHVTLRVVKGARFSDEILLEILTMLRQYLGARMQIDVEFLDHLASVRPGNWLATVSQLGPDFHHPVGDPPKKSPAGRP